MGEGKSASRRVLAWGVALVLWVCFIWGHSLVGGAASSLESGRVVALARPLFEALGVTDVDLMTFVVRKCAHFSEYAVLGVLASSFWTRVAGRAAVQGRAIAVGALLTALVPCVDESIQLLVPGRCASPRDVLIDLAGCMTGVALCTLVRRSGKGFVAR